MLQHKKLVLSLLALLSLGVACQLSAANNSESATKDAFIERLQVQALEHFHASVHAMKVGTQITVGNTMMFFGTMFVLSGGFAAIATPILYLKTRGTQYEQSMDGSFGYWLGATMTAGLGAILTYYGRKIKQQVE